MPTAIPTNSPRAIDQPVTRAGSGEMASTRPASANPAMSPATPPDSDNVTASAKNCRRMSRRDAPSAFRIPISRVRSVTLMSMMFMITMPPTITPIPATIGTTSKMTLVSFAQNAMRPSPVSIVKSLSAPGRSRCAMRIASSARSIAGATPSAVGILTEITIVCRRPYIDSNVLSGSMTKPSHDCPSTVPLRAIKPFTSSWMPRTRVRRAAELLGHVVAEHRDVAALLDVHVGQRLAGRELVVLHHDVRRRDAENEDVAGRAVAPLHVGHRRGPSRLQRDRFGVRDGARDESDVLGRDDRPPLDLLPRFVVDEAHLNRIAADLERVHPDDRARDPLTDVRVHPLDDGDDGDEKCDRDDDAEQREERAEPVAPDRLDGEGNGFVQGHGGKLPCTYSYRRASMGSSRAARLAG